MSKCNCDLCKLSTKIQKARPKWDKLTNEIVNELWNRMEYAETDRDVDEAILHGDWPAFNKSGPRKVVVSVGGKVKQTYYFPARCKVPARRKA